ncbi:MAG: DUF2089 domain-containing protein [Bacteroidota bacterium]|nr:DUF2089 domain-containing protein [Bacteroidota bacterium]
MSKIEKKFPCLCPACNSRLKVQKFHCTACETDVEGLFELPLLASLNNQDQEFIINFIKMSGSLKEMAKIMDKSYPSVRNYLDDLIEKIKTLKK